MVSAVYWGPTRALIEIDIPGRGTIDISRSIPVRIVLYSVPTVISIRSWMKDGHDLECGISSIPRIPSPRHSVDQALHATRVIRWPSEVCFWVSISSCCITVHRSSRSGKRRRRSLNHRSTSGANPIRLQGPVQSKPEGFRADDATVEGLHGECMLLNFLFQPSTRVPMRRETLAAARERAGVSRTQVPRRPFLRLQAR